jgi:hypothetical protein
VRTKALFSKRKFAKNWLNKWVPKKEEKKERKSIFVLSPQSRRGQINNLVYQRNDHSTDFFLLFFKKLLKIFLWILFFDDFLVGKLLFQPPDQGWPTRGPRRNFCGGIQWLFRYFEFFFKCGPQTDSGWPPLLQTDFQGFFVFFLVRSFDRWMKKKPKSKFERITFWTFGHPISHCGFECSAK